MHQTTGMHIIQNTLALIYSMFSLLVFLLIVTLLIYSTIGPLWHKVGAIVVDNEGVVLIVNFIGVIFVVVFLYL